MGLETTPVWDEWDGWVRPIALGNQESPPQPPRSLHSSGDRGTRRCFGTGLPSAPALLGTYCFTDIHILTWLVLSMGLHDGWVWTPAQSLTVTRLSHAIQRLLVGC